MNFVVSEKTSGCVELVVLCCLAGFVCPRGERSCWCECSRWVKEKVRKCWLGSPHHPRMVERLLPCLGGAGNGQSELPEVCGDVGTGMGPGL